MKLGSANMLGQGIHASGEWRREPWLRDGYAVRFADYQLLGRPYLLEMEARRSPLGGDWHVSLGEPFLSDLQHVAWWARVGSALGYTRLEREGSPSFAVGMQRRYHDVGGLLRVGPPRRLGLLGASLTLEHDRPGETLRLRDELPPQRDTTGWLAGRYTPASLARANLLLGIRAVEYIPVRGFDGLSALQDLPVGAQLGVLIGKGMPMLGADGRDLLVAGDLYAAQGTPRGAVRMHMRGEGRRTPGVSGWGGVLGSGQMAFYYRVRDGRTLVTTAEASGGYRVAVPFALRLGEWNGGVHGYGGEQLAGARRAVLRTEDRRVIGRIGRTAELGWAWHAEVGRVWAGEVPMGVTTPIRPAVGLSLLGAFPASSARLWRLDATLPVLAGRRLGWSFRLSRSERSTLTWREPADVAAARARTVPSSLFDWP